MLYKEGILIGISTQLSIPGWCILYLTAGHRMPDVKDVRVLPNLS